jgi:Mn-dependent DtxR family transcriptional regulator
MAKKYTQEQLEHYAMRVLETIEKHGRRRRKDIQEFTELNDHALQRAIWFLEAKGLVEHEDYRPLKITEEGKAWLESKL